MFTTLTQVNPTTVHITAVLVDWVTPTGRPQKGVATTYLKHKAVERFTSLGNENEIIKEMIRTIFIIKLK